MNAIDEAANFFLKFGQVSFIVPIIVLGILFGKREDVEKAACFLAFAIIFNNLLKNIFHIPLPPHIAAASPFGARYAFPSGHTHMEVIFYGYFLYKAKDYKVKAALAALLICCASSMVHFGFHEWSAIFAGAACAIIEIAAYILVEKKFGEKIAALFAISFTLIIICLLYVFYEIDWNTWVGIYFFAGVLAGMKFFKNIVPKRWTQKILALFFVTALMKAVYWLSATLGLDANRLGCVLRLKYFFFPISLYVAMFLGIKTSEFFAQNKKAPDK
ncbi:MAG: phosphatase PAP2 family protein [Holosporaceae bacterium]|jgi:hypothetical protein|nr:phosphatase PAP2 family protein [Holosporaceae bacterium]